MAVVKGNRIEEFDFESAEHKQLKGNIYLAKVTRVEPSLQAAFIDYGGNRHGFLAFSEIHPDYYQIPKADRDALLREEAEHAAEEERLRTAEYDAEDRAAVTLRWFEEHPESELVNFPYIRIGYFDEQLEMFYGAEFDHDAFKKDGGVTYYCNPSTAYKTASGLEVGGYPPETKEKTDDIQFITNWVNAGKRIDFDNRAFACLHRVLPDSMMVGQRGWKPEWVSK